MDKDDGYLATGFRDVDDSANVGKLVSCLKFMQGLPSFIAYKRRSIERLYLRPGNTAVDLGCGLGFDVPKLSEAVAPGGKAIGIDLSEKLLDAAKRMFTNVESAGFQAGIEFVQGDIHALSLAANSVDGIRIDRTLQHVENPQQVISEMVRVTKPGGWVVCAEPDWFTFVIDADNPELTDRIIARWQKGFRNPRIGRQLLRRIRSEKLQNTWAEGFILLADGLDAVNIVYDIFATADKLKAEDSKTADELEKWVENLRLRDKVEGITASVTLFLSGGQKIT